MNNLMPEQCVLVIKTFYQNRSSVVQTQIKLCDSFGQNHIPHKTSILHIVKNFETWYIADVLKSGKPHKAPTAENIGTVRDSVVKNLETSVRRRAQDAYVM